MTQLGMLWATSARKQMARGLDKRAPHGQPDLAADYENWLRSLADGSAAADGASRGFCIRAFFPGAV